MSNSHYNLPIICAGATAILALAWLNAPIARAEDPPAPAASAAKEKTKEAADAVKQDAAAVGTAVKDGAEKVAEAAKEVAVGVADAAQQGPTRLHPRPRPVSRRPSRPWAPSPNPIRRRSRRPIREAGAVQYRVR